MPSSDKTTPPLPRIDLQQVTEETRRLIYQCIVEEHFTWTTEEIVEAATKRDWILNYTADEARVQIIYLAGRWFTFWRNLEYRGASEDQHWSMMNIDEDKSKPWGIGFSEV